MADGRRVVAVLMLGSGLMGVTSSVMWNFTSLYAQSLGYSFYDIGVFNSIGLAASALLIPMLSMLADLYGRKPFALLAALLNAGSAAVLIASPSTPGFAASFVMSNLSFLLWQSARGAIVGDVVRQSELGRAFSRISISFSAATLATPYLAGLLTQTMGYVPTFAIGTATSLAAAGAMALGLPETHGGASRRVTLSDIVRSVVPRGRGEVGLVAITCIDRYGWALWMPFLNPYLKAVYGLTNDVIGALAGLRTGAQLATVYLAGRLVDRLGGVAGFVASEVAGLLSALILGLRVPGPVGPVATMVLFGVSIAFWIPAYNVLAIGVSESRSSVARVYGKMNFFRMSTSIPAPWIGGAIATLVSEALPFIAGASILGLNTLLAYTLRRVFRMGRAG